MKNDHTIQFSESVLADQKDRCTTTLLTEGSLPCLHREDAVNDEFHWFRRASVLTFRNTPERIAEVLVSASVKARQTTCYAMLHGQLHQKILLRNLRLPLKIAKEVLGEFAQERLRLLSWPVFEKDLGSPATPIARAWYNEVHQTTLDAPTPEVAGFVSRASPEIYATRIFAFLIGALGVRMETEIRKHIYYSDMPPNAISRMVAYSRTFRGDRLFLREVGA